MFQKPLYRLLCLFAFLATVLSPLGNVRAGEAQSTALATGNTVNLVWFYKPPKDGNVQLLASRFNPFIMMNDDLKVRDQIISLGARRPFLHYLRMDAIMDPGSCTIQPWRNNVAYKIGDFCDISANHPDWFMLDTNGQRILYPDAGKAFYMMDPGNPGYRAFFLERIREIMKDPNWDGIFLDNVEVTLAFREGATQKPKAYTSDTVYQAAVQGFLQHLSVNYFQGSGKLLYGNIVARRDDAYFTTYLTYLDGAMHEGWSIDWPNRWRSASQWEKQMKLAEDTQAMGKYMLLVGHGTQADTELQNFAFASYLLITNGKAAFRYADDSMYNQIWMYPNYDMDLGTPLGPRYQSGTTWKRDFTNGSVSVDPVTHAASIKQGNSPTPTKAPATATAQPSATSVNPTATKVATSQPAATLAANTTKYDNTNPGFVYSAGWDTLYNTLAGDGSYAQTRTVNATAEFTFTGTGLSIKYTSQIHGGSVDVYVDNVKLGSIKQVETSTKFQYLWKYNGTLSPGSHRLRLVFVGPTDTRGTFDELIVTNTSTTTATSIAPTVTANPATATPTKLPPTATAIAATATKLPATATTVPATATKLPPTATVIPATATKVATSQPTATLAANTTKYDNTNPGFVYSSGWVTLTHASAGDGSYAQTRTVNATAEFTFTGTGLSIKYTSQIHGGSVDVYVDNVKLGSIKQVETSTKFQYLWKYNGTLSPGSHRLRLVFVGPDGKRGTFDELIVTNTGAAVAPNGATSNTGQSPTATATLPPATATPIPATATAQPTAEPTATALPPTETSTPEQQPAPTDPPAAEPTPGS